LGNPQGHAEATDAASISDGLVHGSLPVFEPNEYSAFDMTPLVVATAPSRWLDFLSMLRLHSEIISSPRSDRSALVIDRRPTKGCDPGHISVGYETAESRP
jgi:hypothetical protein